VINCVLIVTGHPPVQLFCADAIDQLNWRGSVFDSKPGQCGIGSGKKL